MRHVSGSHSGLNLWLVQRASALVMALYLPLFAIYALSGGSLDYAAWHTLFVPLWAKVTTLLFVAALLFHAWIGLREIFIDYLHPMAIRLPLMFVFAVLYLGCLVWAADILWLLA
jgi:succinate dehydrogenase membrane anchor subunit